MLAIPATEGRVLHEIYQCGVLIRRHLKAGEIRIRARIPKSKLYKFQKYLIQ
jgi:hypothetical protein